MLFPRKDMRADSCSLSCVSFCLARVAGVAPCPVASIHRCQSIYSCHGQLWLSHSTVVNMSMCKSITDIDGWPFLFAKQISGHVVYLTCSRSTVLRWWFYPASPSNVFTIISYAVKYRIEFNGRFIECVEMMAGIELTVLFNLRSTSPLLSPLCMCLFGKGGRRQQAPFPFETFVLSQNLLGLLTSSPALSKYLHDFDSTAGFR